MIAILRPHPFLSLALAAPIALLLLTSAPAAFAQSAQVQGLIDRVDRLQRELNTLQRQVYRGEPPPTPPADLSTPSNGELTQTQAARLDARLSQLESAIRDLTGRVEELGHQSQTTSAKLDRLAADVELRFSQLEGGAPATTGAASDAQIGALSGAAPAAGATRPPTASQPGTLGAIDPADLEALRRQQAAGTLPRAATGSSAPAAQPAAPAQAAQPAPTGPSPQALGPQAANAAGYALPGDTAQEQYSHAFGLLRQANYGEAELALRAFIERHPGDELTGNAMYWLGETYYVRGNYEQAAVAFADAYQKYPDNLKAADNLLKLGMSLASLGSSTDACGTFAELLKRYPDSAPVVIDRAKQERQRLNCE